MKANFQSRLPAKGFIYSPYANSGPWESFKAIIGGYNTWIQFRYSNPRDNDLVEAILRTDGDNVTKAISNGANVNAVEDWAQNYTPIMFAARQSKPEVIDILGQNRANVYAIAYPDKLSWSFETAIKIALDLNNEPVAKAILKISPDLEKQPFYNKLAWYYKERVGELRSEMQNGTSTGEVKGDVLGAEDDPLNRMFYRLKYGGFLAFGVLSTFALGYAMGHPAYYTTILTVAAIGVAKAIFHGCETVFLPGISDITQGCKLLCSKAVMDTITKIYNVPEYNPLKFLPEYSYEPVGIFRSVGSDEMIR
jgi:hypothetical protein